MCGIAGIVSEKIARYTPIFKQILSCLQHRGPDGAGEWIDANRGVWLGHTRLSIQDLSEQGQQPMRSCCGRYWISYNGEIYNTVDLKRRLRKKSYEGHSDTEVILAHCSEQGFEKTLVQLNGMFAFALCDCEQSQLHLVCDRLGIKPLYYTVQAGEIFFASQLKALMGVPPIQTVINPEALCLYLRHNYIPAPDTIFKNIYKLEPGQCLTFDLKHFALKEKKYYWRLIDTLDPVGSFRDLRSAGDYFHDLLEDAVKRQLVSDVPIGSFLSGGYDSTAVTALMQKNSSRAVKTFSIGFEDLRYNEAPFAKKIAEHLGTDHTEYYAQQQDALNVIPNLPEIYDEPFADASQIPTYLVSKLAKKNVTVCLSGDGGDELFCGYTRYIFLAAIHRKLNRFPMPLRRGIQKMIVCLSPRQWDRLWQAISMAIPKRYQLKVTGDKLHKFSYFLKNPDLPTQYDRLISGTQDPLNYLKFEHCFNRIDPIRLPDKALSLMTYMQTIDFLSYLPGDILTKVDRASMAVSLETRVPLLDHRLVENFARLPDTLKVSQGAGKTVLRHIVHRYVPEKIMARPKKGFGIPVAHWLRHALKTWAEDYLSSAALKRYDFYQVDAIQTLWHNHLNKKADHSTLLWSILMLQTWLERYEKNI